jgi:glycerol-3-phosphate dehydrogenase (NAD(P)+)
VSTPQQAAPIAVLGAGSWGTALAIQSAKSGHLTLLWGRDGAALAEYARAGRNVRYLPTAAFPPGLRLEPDLARAVKDAATVLVSVPSTAFRAMLERLQPLLRPQLGVVWATKGFELHSGKLPHQVAREVLGREVRLAVLSGPTFARELALGLPSAVSIASADPGFAAELAGRLSDDVLRAYTSADIVGVEVGGAVKNVLAIAAGMSDGMGFGANTRVALITRGLAEMTRLGVALGARQETFMGLAALGDLVLTCTDDQSRNRRLGLLLARGRDAAAAEREIGQVVEGVRGAQAVHEVAARLALDLPITEQVYGVLHEKKPMREAVRALMGRELRAEA